MFLAGVNVSNRYSEWPVFRCPLMAGFGCPPREREIRKLIQAIKDGVSAVSIKDELLSLEARKAELQSRLGAPEMPELLHPRMSDVYREKVGSLCLALESLESRTGAREAIRALIETILLERHGDELKITLKGDLAGRLSAATDSKRSPDTGDLLVQIKLVAGAGCRHGQRASDWPRPDVSGGHGP